MKDLYEFLVFFGPLLIFFILYKVSKLHSYESAMRRKLVGETLMRVDVRQYEADQVPMVTSYDWCGQIVDNLSGFYTDNMVCRIYKFSDPYTKVNISVKKGSEWIIIHNKPIFENTDIFENLCQ